MRALEELLGSRFIIKSENKDRYYRLKDNLEEIRKFAAEKMGCQLLVNPLLIKLEKIPARPENYMGIQEFTSPLEYAFLCVLLIFLEDKEAEEQFVLSQVTEFIAAFLKEERVDWTEYTMRRRLIRVLRYSIQTGLLKVSDGDDDLFAGSSEGEVLYENTGVSKYFMQSFSRDIMQFQSPTDFEAGNRLDVENDRGIVRRQRVYKRLLMSPGLYREGETDEDFEYLKRYGSRIQDDLQRYFDCELQLHKNSAYLILGEDTRLGEVFPEKNSLSDIVLLCNQLILEEVGKKRFVPEADESLYLLTEEWEQLVTLCKEKYGDYFVKLYREKTTGEFCRVVTEYMEHMAFLEVNQTEKKVLVRPIAGKVIGKMLSDKKENDYE